MFDDQFARIPADPPRPLELLPGLRFSAVVPRGALLLLLVFVAFFAIVPLTITRSDPALRLELGAAHTVPARVLTATDVPGCRGSGGRKLVYVFTPEAGHEVRGGATVCEDSLYYSVKSGDEVEVRFLGDDPTVNTLASTARSPGPPLAFLALMPLFILVVLTPMFVPQIREGLRARRLYATGRVTKANVVFARRRFSFGNASMAGMAGADVFVAYRNLSGEPRESVAWCPNDWLLNRLDPGATVHIAHDDRGDRVALLDAFLR